MSGALYTREILRLAVSIPHQQRLDKPDGTAELRSRTCGSKVAADVALTDGGTLQDLGLEISACALSQASAAILGAQAIGKSGAEIESIRAHLAAFLEGEVDSPGTWPDMDKLTAAQGHKGRHAAILLPYDAVIAALADAAAKQEAA
ncbi:MAG: iron-sulfur cluster assembly scaffold protein [Sphingomonadales bacterium]|nr:iron-sulfur cluster assembly scaffold protein [Sphingomonadales bacterium]PIX64863.1 MAG: iron-sulfur cluster assembly scaffold protein [Sphingomonadales bacterium CG_4_10_14_3_um_filter_58_15]NCO47893.1 iron-sulfur cluster assembly scaffold protein [Sphingomonadales bacterium]NCO99222.1 iron-sulfur cluster assembly scaffold protein [Sphingomonadales bacterium]NCP27627.1 iron-sulfur cluster assembly scaffold protein [Sphingomonadales bacterium]